MFIRLALLLHCLGTLVMSQPIRFLSQQLAQQVDIQLMSPAYGFSIDQLMELAGLSVASAITHHFPVQSFPPSHQRPRVGIICGPGNNGGDGLVAARHLYHFGFAPEVVYPKAGSGPLFQNLIKQLEMLDIPIRNTLPDNVDTSYALLVDAIFGFSFRGALRPPFDGIIDSINKSRAPIVSIDIPSGWQVDNPDISSQSGLRAPDVLISLTAPKLCAERFAGVHYVGGRFVPPRLARELNFWVPEYANSDQFVLISSQPAPLVAPRL